MFKKIENVYASLLASLTKINIFFKIWRETDSASTRANYINALDPLVLNAAKQNQNKKLEQLKKFLMATINKWLLIM